MISHCWCVYGHHASAHSKPAPMYYYMHHLVIISLLGWVFCVVVSSAARSGSLVWYDLCVCKRTLYTFAPPHTPHHTSRPPPLSSSLLTLRLESFVTTPMCYKRAIHTRKQHQVVLPIARHDTQSAQSIRFSCMCILTGFTTSCVSFFFFIHSLSFCVCLYVQRPQP